MKSEIEIMRRKYEKKISTSTLFNQPDTIDLIKVDKVVEVDTYEGQCFAAKFLSWISLFLLLIFFAVVLIPALRITTTQHKSHNCHACDYKNISSSGALVLYQLSGARHKQQCLHCHRISDFQLELEKDSWIKVTGTSSDFITNYLGKKISLSFRGNNNNSTTSTIIALNSKDRRVFELINRHSTSSEIKSRLIASSSYRKQIQLWPSYIFENHPHYFYDQNLHNNFDPESNSFPLLKFDCSTPLKAFDLILEEFLNPFLRAESYTIYKTIDNDIKMEKPYRKI